MGGQAFNEITALEFAAQLRGTSPSKRVGARVDIRTMLADQLSSTPVQAQRMMDRLARDNRLRENLRVALSPRELQQLEVIAGKYGRQLNIIEGAEAGAKVIGDTNAAAFESAVKNARSTGTLSDEAQALEASSRGTLAGTAGHSPSRAAATAEAMAEHRGLQEKIASALGPTEAERLQKVGEATTRGLRNLDYAAPRTTEAEARAMQQAQELNSLIGAATIGMGHTGGAYKASWMRQIAQRLHIGEGVAKRMAEMATNPEDAPKVIAMMRKAGLSSDEILRIYQTAAVAAGVAVGQR
jgi:hypothetical protein